MEIILFIVAVVAAMLIAGYVNRTFVGPATKQAFSAQGETTARVVTAVTTSAVWTTTFYLAFALIGSTSSLTSWFFSFLFVSVLAYFFPRSVA